MSAISFPDRIFQSRTYRLFPHRTKYVNTKTIRKHNSKVSEWFPDRMFQSRYLQTIQPHHQSIRATRTKLKENMSANHSLREWWALPGKSSLCQSVHPPFLHNYCRCNSREGRSRRFVSQIVPWVTTCFKIKKVLTYYFPRRNMAIDTKATRKKKSKSANRPLSACFIMLLTYYADQFHPSKQRKSSKNWKESQPIDPWPHHSICYLLSIKDEVSSIQAEAGGNFQSTCQPIAP